MSEHLEEFSVSTGCDADVIDVTAQVRNAVDAAPSTEGVATAFGATRR